MNKPIPDTAEKMLQEILEHRALITPLAPDAIEAMQGKVAELEDAVYAFARDSNWTNGETSNQVRAAREKLFTALGITQPARRRVAQPARDGMRK